ncbi:serine rich and transmembrane domain containing 1 [Corythoichthys intestinalis]|uniref:serine rich and transmembrane domain containing 1 n=1 Tax=Corythoichthys intestinalis TaxID=161448 RepID=UPI0025A4D3E8|nr:serine rich and transmembrane domain containing 1 [Corythoichthys intestinalis]XP_061801644.1 serine-rich and transmembrane domain-containing protein 1-like [Nerophis lumbriciformis]
MSGADRNGTFPRLSQTSVSDSSSDGVHVYVWLFLGLLMLLLSLLFVALHRLKNIISSWSPRSSSCGEPRSAFTNVEICSVSSSRRSTISSQGA